MEKVRCSRCGNEYAEILYRGKNSKDVLFCPHCDDICKSFKPQGG